MEEFYYSLYFHKYTFFFISHSIFRVRAKVAKGMIERSRPFGLVAQIYSK